MEDVIRITGIETGMSVLEPCAGNGAIAQPLKDHGVNVTTCDISDYGYPLDIKGDFLQMSVLGKFDMVITNPPFQIAEPFLRHCLNYSDEVWALLRTLYVEGKERNPFLVAHLEEVHNYSGRVSCKSGKNAIAFSWFRFVKTKPGAGYWGTWVKTR